MGRIRKSDKCIHIFYSHVYYALRDSQRRNSHFRLWVDIIYDYILVDAEDRRSIVSQHFILLESLILNPIYLDALLRNPPHEPMKQSSFEFIPSEYMRLDCLIW